MAAKVNTKKNNKTNGGTAVTGVINDYRGKSGKSKPTAGPSPSMKKGGSSKMKKK